ncbi:MAG: 16S rRNA (cytosine(1402)-N(4))-methyltransferase RsmH [Stappiaceae bacterium]
MTDRRATPCDSAGGPVRHVPVLLAEVLLELAPKSGDVIIDGTFGAGGYSTGILEKGASVIGVDRDPGAIVGGQGLVEQYPERLTLIEGRFGELDRHARAAGFDQVDGVVLDLGVSSMQLDEAERGFSFQKDGPLDMRMEQKGASAADVVNKMPVRDLIRIIGMLGEERRAPAVAHAIDAARKEKPFTRTLELAAVVEKVVGRNPKAKIHPATRTFQGLRLYINGELNEVAQSLQAAEAILKSGGRLVVVSFHSLEDRIVKKFFADRCRTHSGGSRHLPETDVPDPTFAPLFKGAVGPGDEETSLNPRARSSRMRGGRRTDAAARSLDPKVVGLARMPGFGELGD